jgi:hypothetical protein
MAEDDKPKEDVQSFIFARELAEVYLLLDFLSGRSDKNLSTAFNGADMPPVMSVGGAVAAAAGSPPQNSTSLASTHAWIGAICQIKWPPADQGGKPPTAAQATTLLLAKDHLNSAAQPANGLSIAFSLMVAGDDDGARVKARKGVAVSDALSPSRVSLAQQAYPNLMATASSFRHWMNVINLFLFVWLFVTCLLSWNVTIGHALVLRLDAIEAASVAIYKQIPDAETARAKATPASEEGKPVKSFCPRATEPRDLGQQEFTDSTHRRICYELADNRFKYKVARENLAEWVSMPWRIFKYIPHQICGGRCLDDNETVKSASATNDQWAASLLEVLATAVLPLCYGFLGAGAAVVRGIWGKMRYSLLTPRDLRLASSQLALGAVIGACIGLFITPSAGSAQEGAALFNGPVALSASALSFIAGFGVEGVFQTMEALIRRIFDIKEAK